MHDDNKSNKSKNPGDQSMQDAMSRKIPSDANPDAPDQMREAMKENRVGAKGDPIKGDQQQKAMSNEFETQDDPAKNAQENALSETRKQAKKPKA